MNKTLLYILLMLAFASCKKIKSDLENAASNLPIYKIEGSINNESFDYTVNDTSIFMNHGIADMNGVTTFFSEFSNEDNSTALKLEVLAPEKIYKELNQYQLGDQLVPFLVHQAGCYDLDFSVSPPNPPLIYFQEEDNFTSDKPVELEGYGIFEIPVRFKGLSSETYSITIKHGFEPTLFSAAFTVATKLDGISVKSDNITDNHQWFLDGVALCQDYSCLFTTENGLHNITHIITDHLGNTCTDNQIIYVYGNTVKWQLETNACSSETQSNNFGEVIITYTENNETYSSAFASENENLKFAIQNIEYFRESPTSNAISFKFDTSFSGTLYNADKSKKKILSDVRGTCKYKIE
ncbi:MAG: hypothetical protein R3279_07790 [Putridiphycobacter sp.]|nr:hypothetical protein [Putridiphycobacter sp.]